MKRNLFLVGLALGTAVTLVGCSQSSPTAPKQPTPVANTVSLAASPTVAGINESILLVAQISAGSGNVPDGTAVTFDTTIGAFVENGKQEETRTTSGGKATATLGSLNGGDGLVSARVGSGSASTAVHFRGGSAAQLAISSVLPNRGKPQGGDQVIIRGQGFIQPLDVTFVVGAGSYPAVVTAVATDGSSITVLTPQIPGGVAADRSADITVTLRGVTGTNGQPVSVTAAGIFTFSADTGIPLLYNVAPVTGSASGGDILALTGKYFTEPIEVDFAFTDPNGNVAKNVAARVVDVQHGSDGTDTAHVQTPRASTGSVSQTIPVDFTIKNLVGGNNSQSNTFRRVFTYVPDVTTPPTIFYISPTFGSVAGNETVMIYGKNFVQPVTVQIGATNETVQSVSADGSSIAVVTRPLSGTVPTAAVDVTVTTTLGVATLPSAFTYLEGQAPQLYVLTPNLGPIAGGTNVTITGTGFQYPVQVLFGSLQAQVVSANFNQVVCISPSITPTQPNTPTTVQVSVTNTGSGKVSNTLPFQYGQAMFVSSITPGTGPDTGGTSVTIFGQGFASPVSVSFAGIAAQVVSVSATQIVATTGAVLQRSCSSVSGPVSVTNVASNLTATGPSWTYTPANPLIASVAVSNCGSGSGNTVPGNQSSCTLTVNGSGFESNMQLSLANPIALIPANSGGTSTQAVFTLSSSLESLGITYNTTACTNGKQNLPTPIDVKITNLSNKCTNTLSGGLIAQPSDTTCQGAPQLYTLTPNIGPLEGGTRVTITGTGFQYPVQVLFGALQAQVVSTTLTQVVCISPSITPTQPTTPITVQVSVTNISSGKVSANTLPFQYGQSMFISAISPTLGPDTGGTTVTITGQGFVAPVTVSFAGVAAQVLSVAGTQIVATTGGVLTRSCSPINGTVIVTNTDSNTSATGPGWTYTAANPQISSVTSTCTNGASTGCTITVNGSGFESNMQLSFTNPAMTLPENSGGTSTQAVFTMTNSFEALGIKYNTAACTNGTQNLTTPIDVKITNPSNHCTNTLAGGLLVQPSDTSCKVTTPLTMTLAPATASIAAGTSITYAVNLSRPAQSSDGANMTVIISPSGSGVIASPTSLTLPIAVGQQTVTFNVQAGTNAGTATITASYGGTSATANLTVTTASNGIIFNPSSLSLAPGGGSTIGISINPAAATATAVTVTLTGPSGVVVAPAFPQTVNVPAGGTGTLAITAGTTAGTVTLQGSATGLTSGSATVTVTAPAVTLTLTPASQTLVPTQSASLSVTITPPPSAPATVNLTLAGPSGVLVSPVFPTTVTVPISGTVSVPITAGSTNGTVTINGSYGTATASATVTVQTTPLTLSLAPASQTLAVGGTANFIVNVNQAQPVPITVYITQNGPNGIIAFGPEVTGSPASVTIPANQTFTNFTVTGLNVGGPVTVTGTLPPAYGSGTATSSVTVSNFILSLSPNPMNLGVGATTNMTVTLNNPAPATTSVTLTSAAPGIASVPSPVVFAAGSTTATAVVTGVAPGTTTITAGPVPSLGGAQATTTVTVTPYTFTLAPNPMTLAPGGTATLTATLNNPAASGHTTQLVIGAVPAGIATLGTNTLIFPPGTTTATTVVTAVGAGTATVAANLQIDAVTVSTSNWTVTTLSTLTLAANPSTIAAWVGGQFIVQLTLSSPAPAAITVPLTVTGPTGVISTPVSVPFVAGATTAQFTITANSVSPNGVPNVVVATLPGQYGGGQATVSVTVNLPLTFTPTSLSIASGQSANVIVTMAAVQPGNTTVTLTWGGTLPAPTFPATAIIPAFTTFTTFTVTGAGATAGSITGTLPPTLPQGLGGATANLAVTVTGLPPYTITLAPNPLTVATGATANLTITLNQAATVTSTVTLASLDPTKATVSSASVTFTPGVTSRTVVVTGVAIGTTQITATGDANLNNAFTSTTVNVTPPYTITLTPNPLNISLAGGATQNLTVTLNQPAPNGGATVTLASGNSGIATVTTPVIFSAGTTTATAVVTGVSTGTTQITATSTAVLNSATTTSTVIVAP